MYRIEFPEPTTLTFNEGEDGEMIETTVERLVESGEPIQHTRAKMFTERKDGVLPELNIRTDRFEVALNATTAHAKAQVAKRQSVIDAEQLAAKQDKDGEPKPTHD